jgi:hypothetical protein
VAAKKKPDEWMPTSAVPAEDEWMPQSAKVPVRAHGRRPRSSAADVPLVYPSPFGPITVGRESVAEALPMVLGTAAGTLTKPFAYGVPAAAAAGAAGELGSQLLMGETPDWGEIGRQGAAQGAYEATGRGIGKVLGKLSGPIMQLALRAGPDVAETALREGIKPTKLGVRRLLKKLGQYGAETDRVAQQAARHGKPYDMFQMLKGAYADVYPKVVPSMTGDELAALQKSLFRFVGQNPRASSTAFELHKLKKVADAAAAEIYATLPKGVKPTAAQQATSGFYKAFADRAREALNQTVEGYAESNAPTEALIKLRDVLVPVARKDMSKAAQVASAVMKPGVRAAIGASVGAALPGDRSQNAMLGAGVGVLGASPTALAGLAALLSNPLAAMFLRQAPRALGAMSAPPR